MIATATARCLETNHGILQFPCFLPVTTFGGKFPLDDLVRPYLPRMVQGVMVSHFYAQKMKKRQRPNLPLFIDSGGFASLFDGSRIDDCGEVAVIRTKDGNEIHPAKVLTFQEKHADIGATVDFLIPPNLDSEEAQRRQDLTIKNALWSLHHRTNSQMKLFASLQVWDRDSALRIMDCLTPHQFDGFALGGMVPRLQTPRVIFDIVAAVRSVEPNRPLHVFGIGSPEIVRSLFESGVDSIDTSSFLQYAAKRKYLVPKTGAYVSLTDLIGQPVDYCNCDVCIKFGKEYLALEGELNGIALVLHNLKAIVSHANFAVDPSRSVVPTSQKQR